MCYSCPLTEHQGIALVKQVIKKNSHFQQAYIAWNNRTKQPTWLAFKQFFLEQQAQFKLVLEDTPAGQMYHAPSLDHELMMQLMNMLLDSHETPAPAPKAPAPAPAPPVPALAPAPPPP